MASTRLLIFDEVSMIGRQIMGKISSRCAQAKSCKDNPDRETLGNMSCIAVGDPAQCPPIRDDVHYDEDPHRDTRTDPTATRVLMSNQGLHVFSTFDEVIVLQQCHRIHQREGESLTEEDFAYNERGQRFLSIMCRLRDCVWDDKDYYWLCKRKMSQLSMDERASFADAPVIMEFRKERADDDPHDSC